VAAAALFFTEGKEKREREREENASLFSSSQPKR
jgi:hypothetical protein